MSYKATAWAWEQKIPYMQKIVLLALADRHNNDTERCDPSIARVAADCGMSRDSVKRAIAELESKGLIQSVNRKDGLVSLTNLYVLKIPVGANGTGGGGKQPPKVGANSTTNLELEPVIESTSKSADALFELETPKPSVEEDVVAEGMFDYYRKKIEKTFAKFTPDRKKKTIARYRECLKEAKGDKARAREWMEIAIDELAASDFHNARGKYQGQNTFNDYEQVFRSWKTFEKWLNRSNGQ